MQQNSCRYLAPPQISHLTRLYILLFICVDMIFSIDFIVRYAIPSFLLLLVSRSRHQREYRACSSAPAQTSACGRLLLSQQSGNIPHSSFPILSFWLCLSSSGRRKLQKKWWLLGPMERSSREGARLASGLNGVRRTEDYFRSVQGSMCTAFRS